MTQNLSGIYNNRITSHLILLKSVEKKITLISSFRLFTALLIVVCFYFALTNNHQLFYLFFLLIALFIVQVIVHSRLFKQKNLLINFVRINREEDEALQGNNDSFEKGSEFINQDHAYDFDLDIFGKGSLFEFLCRTVTYAGKLKLADSLSKPCLQLSQLLVRQKSIKELSDKLDFRQNFRARGLLLNESQIDRDSLKNWLEGDVYFTKQRFLKYLVYILPLLTVSFLIQAIVQQEMNIFLISILIVNVLLYGNYSKKINAFHMNISRKKNILENYSEMFALIEQERFNSPELQQLHQDLEDASFQFKKLARYVGWMDQRLNILFMPFANFIFLYDLHCCIVIEKWKNRNDDKVNNWMQSVGEVDCICSLANMEYNSPDFVFPELDADDPLLIAKDLAHPLIYKNRVTNSFELGTRDKIAVITGANMSGKSTFLRTVGVNAVLAYCGAPVCAKFFKISLMHIHSSMRISDSLKDHASYFYAELQRLKSMKESLMQGQKCLVLLDEMLKGTNSNDKQQGSKAFVESLLEYNCLALMATHDLELGKLEVQYPAKIKNYSFESFLTQNKLTFDYKIKEGIAVNTNAIFLMKDMGII